MIKELVELPLKHFIPAIKLPLLAQFSCINERLLLEFAYLFTLK